MRILRDDTFSRRSGDLRPPGHDRSGALLFALMFISVALLVLSKLNHGFVRDFRASVAEFVAPVLSAASVPIQPLRRTTRQISANFELFKELHRLKEENRKLKAWEWRAKQLQWRVDQLDSLARVVKEPALDFATARVIADASGPFVRIALINAGTSHGVKSGFPVINGDGLVGRIVDTSASASRLLLLSDLNSRIPVLVGTRAIRALMLGDNSRSPRLDYLPLGEKVTEGEDVYTSGIGGLFPRGLRIGKVRAANGSLRVNLLAQFDNLDFVTVLFFHPPALEQRSMLEGTSVARRAYHRYSRTGLIGNMGIPNERPIRKHAIGVGGDTVGGDR